jgi:hypothetical protein
MSVRVRAKFKCVRNEFNSVNLEVVHVGSEENEKFFKYTPGGSIHIVVDNEVAREQFEVGKEYYVDFTKAE